MVAGHRAILHCGARQDTAAQEAMMSAANAPTGWQLEGDSAHAYEQYLASAFRPWADELIARAGLRRGERVLDVACGTGIVARQAAAVVGTGGRIVGVDVNEDMLRVARAASASGSLPIEWQQGDAEALPFPDRAFDVVFCHQGLVFFPQPAAALAGMRRVLAPAGRAAISSCRAPAFCPTYAILADALDRHVSAAAGRMMRSPFSLWTIAELRRLLVDAGFADVHLTIDVRSLRYPSIEELLRREAASSPLAAALGGVASGVRRALLDDLESALADHVDDDGIVCPVETYCAIARR
jgi:ubiquinone/menaquinone biosynthesis C-methylase UbiE